MLKEKGRRKPVEKCFQVRQKKSKKERNKNDGNNKTSSLVQHSSSDHLQVFKHTQVCPVTWPCLNVQVAWGHTQIQSDLYSQPGDL